MEGTSRRAGRGGKGNKRRGRGGFRNNNNVVSIVGRRSDDSRNEIELATTSSTTMTSMSSSPSAMILDNTNNPLSSSRFPSTNTASPLMPRRVTTPTTKIGSSGLLNNKTEYYNDDIESEDLQEESVVAAAADLWDPMKEMFNSFKNLNIHQPSLINNNGSFTTRFPKTYHEDFPCPFQKVPGEVCFKGTLCKYQHGKYTPEMLKGRPKLIGQASAGGEEIIEISESLPKKWIPAEGFVTLAWIPTTYDPSEFYVIPWNGWQCLCKCNSSAWNTTTTMTRSSNNNSDDDEGIIEDRGMKRHSHNSRINRGGLEVLNKIFNGMKSYYEVPRKQMDGYSAGELVAVRMKTESVKGDQKKAKSEAPGRVTGEEFFRAVVMEDTEQIEDAIGVVKVKLLDFGLEIEKSQVDVWCLAERFTFVGPLAYKSQLYGVNPILGKWGKKPTQKFNEFVSGQVCLVEVKRTVYPDLDGLFESPPLLLNVWAKVNGEFVSMKDYLVEEGMGIEWNPFPLRPFASQVLPMKGYEYAVKEIKTDGDIAALEEIYTSVMEREQSRLDRYIERLKCRHGLDEDLQ